ncbi:diguanylate cyclase [Limnothrix redekei]|uniref:Diguanylate cyclase n=1 Tax=Limnothrix redekei LRLZ20PSL1 TaxID=3112953 RepID=A0ABW7CBU7_9CYAN
MLDSHQIIPAVRSLSLGEAGYLAATQALVISADKTIADMVQHLQGIHPSQIAESQLIVLVLPTAQGEKPIGVLTVSELTWAVVTQRELATSSLMSLARPPVTLPAQTNLQTAWDTFQAQKCAWLVLLEEQGVLAGVISRTALLEAVVERGGLAGQLPESAPESDYSPLICSQPVHGYWSAGLTHFLGQVGDGIAQVVNDGAWEWNLTTDRLVLSPRWKALLGYGPSELADEWATWEQRLIEEDRSTLNNLRQAVQVNQANCIQLIQRFEHRNQNIVHGLVRAVRHSAVNGEDILWGVLTDISELARTQQELADILDSSIDGIAALRTIRNGAGQIVDFLWTAVNASAEMVLGRSRNQLLNRQLLDQVPLVRQDGLFEAYVRVVETGQAFSRSLRIAQVDGRDAWLQLTAVKLGDGLTLTFRDVTQTKQAEQVLQETNQQLERRIEELKFRNREMALLSEMIDFLQVCVTVEEAYTAVADLVQALFPGCSGALFTLESTRVALEAVATWGPDPIGETLFYPDDCWALRRGRIHWAEHKHTGLLCRHAHPLGPQAESLCLPMMAQSETLGLLYLCTPQHDSLSAPKQQLARTVAEQVALAISNLRLRETLQQQSIRDPLTGLYNRRYLEEALEQAVCRARRDRSPIGAIILDIDHFKQFNDTFGHDAGDLVLQEVAQFLQSRIRGSDIACRYGGEEMTLILPGATLEETVQRAEVMCQELKYLSLRHGGQTLGAITASFGVASFPQHAVTVATLLQAADAALYQAKWAGRDRVVVAQS